jgi:hypothetical protein
VRSARCAADGYRGNKKPCGGEGKRRKPQGFITSPWSVAGPPLGVVAAPSELAKVDDAAKPWFTATRLARCDGKWLAALKP